MVEEQRVELVDEFTEPDLTGTDTDTDETGEDTDVVVSEGEEVSPPEADEDLPAKFRGMSAADVVRAYQELEAKLGEQAREVAEARKVREQVTETGEKPNSTEELTQEVKIDRSRPAATVYYQNFIELGDEHDAAQEKAWRQAFAEDDHFNRVLEARLEPLQERLGASSYQEAARPVAMELTGVTPEEIVQEIQAWAPIKAFTAMTPEAQRSMASLVGLALYGDKVRSGKIAPPKAVTAPTRAPTVGAPQEGTAARTAARYSNPLHEAAYQEFVKSGLSPELAAGEVKDMVRKGEF